MNRIAVIGASAGAVEALSTVLPGVKKSTFPIVVVVHLPPKKDNILAQLLQARCGVPVKEAEDKETLQPGIVYIAPPDYHLLIEREGCFALSSEEPVMFSRPSIDVLFESAADAYGTAATGILLTGANSDGAAGLQAIAQNGGTALVQDPMQAYASAMPEAALLRCPSARALSLQQIASHLESLS